VNYDEGMPNRMKQARAASHIRELLLQRGVNIPSQSVAMGDEQWVVFEYEGRQIGIDPASGIWVRESDGNQWRCLADEHSMSGAFLAVGLLTK